MRCHFIIFTAVLQLAYASPIGTEATWGGDTTPAQEEFNINYTNINGAISPQFPLPQRENTFFPLAERSSSSSCPATTGNKTSATSKATRWLAGLFKRAPNYGSLDVPTAAEPLDQWATKIYKATDKHKAVYIDFETELEAKPTSRFEEFKDDSLYLTLTGLYGCTSVTVVSYCGAYMAHFWEAVMGDAQYKLDHNPFIAGAADALKGIKNEVAQKKANAGKLVAQDILPSDDFISLQAHQACLSKDMGARAFIMTPAKSNRVLTPLNPNTVAALTAVVADLTGLDSKDIATHVYISPGESVAKAKTNGKGKVLLSYSPDTGARNEEHAYQVHISKADTPAVTLAIGDTWHGDANQCTCKSSPLLVKTHDPTCCCAIQ